jgi:hypothetical protein
MAVMCWRHVEVDVGGRMNLQVGLLGYVERSFVSNPFRSQPDSLEALWFK